MKKIKPKKYTKVKDLKSVWSDKKNYLIHYRNLNIFVRHGMVVEKSHELSSFKQNKLWEKKLNFITQN